MASRTRKTSAALSSMTRTMMGDSSSGLRYQLARVRWRYAAAFTIVPNMPPQREFRPVDLNPRRNAAQAMAAGDLTILSSLPYRCNNNERSAGNNWPSTCPHRSQRYRLWGYCAGRKARVFPAAGSLAAYDYTRYGKRCCSPKAKHNRHPSIGPELPSPGPRQIAPLPRLRLKSPPCQAKTGRSRGSLAGKPLSNCLES